MPDIRFYLSLLLRRLHYVVILTALGLAAGLTVARILPPTYIASARLVVESEQISSDIVDSTVSTRVIEQLQIIEQRIKSRDRLLDIAERLGVYNRRAGEAQPLRPDEIVDDMRERVVIAVRTGEARRRSDAPQVTTVNVRFSAERADLAAAVANDVVTQILQESQRIRTGVSGDTLEFFEQEVERLDAALSESSARIVSFQNANREALPDSLEFRRSQMTAAQERLLQLQRDEATLRDRRDNLVALYEATGGLGEQAEEALTPEARQLRELRDEYRTQGAVLSDQNPRMRVLQSRIDTMAEVVAEQEAIAAAIEGSVGSGANPLNPFDVQIADLDRQIEQASEQREQLQAEIDRLEETIAQTPANAVTLDALKRNYQNLREQYDQAVERRARAETGDIIESLAKGERISVIEQAVAPLEPASPDRPKLVIAGTGAGLLAGLGLVALLELLTTAVRRPSEIVDKLDIAPLATLSYIATRREVMRRRALIAGAFAVAIVGVPAGLWAVDFYVMPLDLIVERAVEALPDPLREVIETAGVLG